MRAVVAEKPGSPEILQIKEIPQPEPREGWVLIHVKAFGLNRSEMYSRQGHSGDAVTFPRVFGIECVGQVVAAPGSDLQPGQTVAAAMGSMGRKYDGGYAEYALIPRSQVMPIETTLSWTDLAAIPETYITAWGVLMEAIDVEAGQTILVRGGTSSVGRAVIDMLKDMDCTVITTTRSQQKKAILEAAGADHIIVADGDIAQQVRAIVPQGVDGVVELVGSYSAIMDSLSATRRRGVVSLVGFLGNEWDYGFAWMPSTVRLTLYTSEEVENTYYTPILQEIVKRVEAGRYHPNIDRVFQLEEIVEAHRIMENNQAAGKLVVQVDSDL
ncbi:MAG: zinc-binding dehydrogenase [Chitinophagaceae bacterium]|nr:zinc-binding dehydrogenase [Anaerolineae bacterium]